MMKRYRIPKKERIQLEQIFLSCILAEDIYTDWRRITAEKYPCVTWRHFADRKHQALWRALQTLDLKNELERRRTAEKELRETPSPFYPGMDAPEDDLLRGQPGSAAERVYLDNLRMLSSARAWLIREIENAGALFLAGGKSYLHLLYGLYPVSLAAGLFARRLGFLQKEEEQAYACWNCALAHGAPPVMKCGLSGYYAGAYDGGDCEYWEKPPDLYEKIIKTVKGEEE